MDEQVLANAATSRHKKLVEELSSAANKRMTRQEIFEQEVSYVYGNMPFGNRLTKDDVRRYLRNRRGD